MSLINIGKLFDEVVSDTTTRCTYLGESDTIYDNGENIKASLLCPKRGMQDPNNGFKIITEVTVEQRIKDGPTQFWEIAVTSQTSDLNYDDPLTHSAIITLDSEQFDTTTCWDNDGKAILNTAGDLLYMVKEDSRWVFNVEKNVPYVPNSILQFNNAVNDGVFSIAGLQCDKGTLMVKRLRAGKLTTVTVGYNQVSYMVLSFQIHYKREGWQAEHPNVGYNELVEIEIPEPDDVVVGRVKRRDGKIVYSRKIVKRKILVGTPPEMPGEAQLLDSQGRYIKDPKPGDLIKVKKDIYPERNYNELPLT